MTFRIAMVGACPFPVPQGSQVLLRDTALGLRNAGHEVHLLVYGYGIGEDTSGLTIHRCPRIPFARRTAAGPSPAKPLLDLALAATLRRVLRQKRIEIVHAHNYEGLVVALTARARPIIYHAHNAMADELPHYFRSRRISARLGAWMDRHLPKRADFVIAPHQRLADYLAECGCRRERIAIIPPSVEVGLFEPGEQAGEIPPVLYTGNLDPYQNLDLLLRAMARVRERLPGTRLCVATAAHGEVPGAEMVRTSDFGALQRVLRQDAVFACPRTSWSGYPIKLLNAMAAGKAMVACASAAHPLTHEHDGLVTPDDDDEAFAAALMRLLTTPGLRAKLGENARATASEHHAPSEIASAIEQVYQEAKKVQ